MPDRKKIGCCTVCDEPIFEILSRHTEGPYKGEAKQLGRPLPGVRRATIVRVSGRVSDWSLCSACEIHPLDMPRLNKKEIAAMAYERNIVIRETLEQKEAKEQMLRLFEFDVPLGVLGEKPWLEVK